jgi:hypothetical protein
VQEEKKRKLKLRPHEEEDDFNWKDAVANYEQKKKEEAKEELAELNALNGHPEEESDYGFSPDDDMSPIERDIIQEAIMEESKNDNSTN